MILGLDKYNNLEVPSFILCKPNGDRIDTIKCTEKKAIIKFNDYDEITFTTYLYTDNKKNDVYDKINELMHIELPEIGNYVISNISINSEGTNYEFKECTALSEEVLLAQKYLELFTINMGTTESIDGVQFYNLSSPSKSLLHLALGKCPNWSIGHVDNELYQMQRCFEITRQDVYSFLTQDVSKAFECIFDFDTISHKINVYTEKKVGEDTNIHISYSNLAKNVDISSSTDDIKTCLTVIGADDLSLREVNMGQDRIYNIDYFHDLEYMSQGLYNAYTKWKTLWNSNVSKYENLVTQYQKYYEDIYYLESEKMPDDPNSKDWTLYGLNPLKEKLEANKQKQAVMIKAGQGDSKHKDYKTMYLPVYNEIQAINKQIAIVEESIADLKIAQNSTSVQMDAIIQLIDMKKNFTTSQLKELSKFIREDELSSDNYVVTDTMTDSERMDMLHDMLEYGQKELAKVSVPTMQFSMDMINIYAIPEFKEQVNKFNVGNYIFVTLRDDFSLKLRLLSIDINFFDKDDFSVTFGNVAKIKGNKLLEDITNALDMASSAATTVSFSSSYWNKANVESTSIGKMLSDGLLASGKRIQTTKSDVVIDDRGIIISSAPNSKYKDDVIFLGGGQIVFSDDNLKTIKTALGRVQYTKEGTPYTDFGLLAKFVITGYVGGSVIEGNTITNGNGTFKVDPEGNLTATSATITGEVTATSGYIGDGTNGFTITSKSIYNGKSSLSATKPGVYIGTDGISLGYAEVTNVDGTTSSDTPFKVTKDGILTAKDVTITGRINANKGRIGGANGFTINEKKMYSNGKSAPDHQNAGVYIGTDAIALGSKTKTNSDGTTSYYAPFKVTSAGVLTATSATIEGKITATSGYIGGENSGFVITSKAIYNKTNSLSSTKEGIYIGTDGIRQYNSNDKYVNISNGMLSAYGANLYNATINNATITDLETLKIKAGNTEIWKGEGNVDGENSGAWGSFTIHNETSVTFDTPNIYVFDRNGWVYRPGITTSIEINGINHYFEKGIYVGYDGMTPRLKTI